MITQPAWRTSTYSGQNDNCVEVAKNVPGAVFVRDTKDHEAGSFAASPAAWSSFMDFAKEQSI
ncbi:DUF397 domain-containing protein [Streptomyces sp. H27-H5]|uniref:DUF397 domain-containing protein n=1 Tax=Streptomyces sp. H27-H5 TaxID=2996460 RepID=UPI00226DAC18|nr:DUF397 domain-containing protein [Streptomyces sp. H27-H5]MCY0955837.1 DUF397 domain-containing protein [Streptomyces sp. H27-H5]